MRRVVIATIVATLSVVAFATEASAHALVDHSDPAAGAILQSPPSSVKIWFTEPPDPALSIVHVLDSTGRRVEAGPAAAVASDSKELRVPLPSGLPDGVYTVSWRAVSETDGHVSAGAFSFGVGVVPPAAGSGSTTVVPKTPTPSPASVAGKAAMYIGLALLLAAGAVGLYAFRGDVPRRGVVLVVGWLLAAAGTIVFVLAERATVGVSLHDLLSSSAGRPFVSLLVAVGALGIATVFACVRSARWSLALVGLTASAAMLVRVVGGHADSSSTPPIQVPLQWFHFMAAGVWIGGIALTLLLVLTRRGDQATFDSVRRFSKMAGYALAVIVVTGVLREINELGGISALFHILSLSYGVTLVLKTAAALVLISLGTVNRYRSIPRMEQSTDLLRRVLTGELVVAVGIFGLTGTLTGFAPKLPPSPEPQRPSEVTAAGNDFATTTKIRLVVTPGTAGLNAFDAAVTDYDTGKPISADRVSLTLQPVGRPDVGKSTLELRRGADGHWLANGTELSIQGTWNIMVLVQTGARATEVPLTLATRAPPQTVSVSRAAGQPDLYTITLQNGLEIQAYNDPGKPGTNELHLTAFDATGSELPLSSATMTAIPPQGAAIALNVRRFGPGHFVGDERLVDGPWHFELQATARNGTVLVASFDQTISP